MSKWLLLGSAIVAEVIGTLTLRATIDHPGWAPLVVVAYVAAFACIGLALRAGMQIGVVYGIWGATGVALVAVLSMVIFGETLSTGAIVGIAVIIAGVILVETGSDPAPPGTNNQASA